MSILKWTTLIILLTNVFGCNGRKDSEPTKDSIFADVLVKKTGEKTTAQFMFYSDISEVVNGKEIKGFGKNPVVVDFPKINGAAMKEIENNNAPKMYSAEIESLAKVYTVTFSRKDGEYQSVIHINPNDLSKPVKAAI